MPATGTWAVRGGWVVKRLAADLELTFVQASGPVGNLGFESDGFTKLHEVGQPEGVGGYGWAQWTGPRREAFFAWCDGNGLDWESDEANYGYLLTELRGAYKATVAALKQTGTVEAAVWSFGQTYERPGGTTPSFLPGYNERLMRAKEALIGASGGSPLPIPDPVLAAVKALQTALGVTADGIWGPHSQAAMQDWVRGRY